MTSTTTRITHAWRVYLTAVASALADALALPQEVMGVQ